MHNKTTNMQPKMSQTRVSLYFYTVSSCSRPNTILTAQKHVIRRYPRQTDWSGKLIHRKGIDSEYNILTQWNFTIEKQLALVYHIRQRHSVTIKLYVVCWHSYLANNLLCEVNVLTTSLVKIPDVIWTVIYTKSLQNTFITQEPLTDLCSIHSHSSWYRQIFCWLNYQVRKSTHKAIKPIIAGFLFVDWETFNTILDGIFICRCSDVIPTTPIAKCPQGGRFASTVTQWIFFKYCKINKWNRPKDNAAQHWTNSLDYIQLLS